MLEQRESCGTTMRSSRGKPGIPPLSRLLRKTYQSTLWSRKTKTQSIIDPAPTRSTADHW